MSVAYRKSNNRTKTRRGKVRTASRRKVRKRENDEGGGRKTKHTSKRDAEIRIVIQKHAVYNLA